MENLNQILLHIPHAGTGFLNGNGKWEPEGCIEAHIHRWTDWHTDKLFYLEPHPRIRMVKAELSRFEVDVERLEDDPLEAEGRGIIYTHFEDCTRRLTPQGRAERMDLYQMWQNQIESYLTSQTLLIDCHSFPSDICPDIDICIGFNEDWSRPSNALPDIVTKAFTAAGYRVGLNRPYSNSFAPRCDFDYPSLMIEVNKRVYMNENTLLPRGGIRKMRRVLKQLYGNLLTPSEFNYAVFVR